MTDNKRHFWIDLGVRDFYMAVMCKPEMRDVVTKRDGNRCD